MDEKHKIIDRLLVPSRILALLSLSVKSIIVAPTHSNKRSEKNRNPIIFQTEIWLVSCLSSSEVVLFELSSIK